MADDGLDLDPLLERLPEPGFMAVGMGAFPFFVGIAILICAPPPPAVLLLPEGLVKTPIGSHLLRCSAGVPLDAAEHLAHGLHIRHVPRILLMGKDQAVVILGQRHQGAELAGREALSLLDHGHILFVQRV